MAQLLVFVLLFFISSGGDVVTTNIIEDENVKVPYEFIENERSHDIYTVVSYDNVQQLATVKNMGGDEYLIDYEQGMKFSDRYYLIKNEDDLYLQLKMNK